LSKHRDLSFEPNKHDIKRVAQALAFKQLNGERAKSMFRLMGLFILPNTQHSYSVSEISILIEKMFELLLMISVNPTDIPTWIADRETFVEELTNGTAD